MNLTGHRINNDNDKKADQPIIRNVNKIVLLHVASNKLITNTKRCIGNLYATKHCSSIQIQEISKHTYVKFWRL